MPKLGDLVARLALGRNPLLRGEIDELRLKLNNIEGQIAALQPLIATPGEQHLSRPFISQPHWDRAISDFSSVWAGTGQDIPGNGVETAISWSTTPLYRGTSRIYFDAAQPTRIMVKNLRSSELWMLFGWMGFEANADTGKRLVKFAGDGGSGDDLACVGSAGADDDTEVPFCNVWITSATDTYLTVKCAQTSGIALEVRANSEMFMLYLGRLAA